jgi:hypothetical protein
MAEILAGRAANLACGMTFCRDAHHALAGAVPTANSFHILRRMEKVFRARGRQYGFPFH